MEFEKNSPITDEQRELAQTKKVTVEPMNPFLKPEENTVQVSTNETHANIDRDSENTANPDSLVKPSVGATNQPTPSQRLSSKIPITTLIIAGLFVLIIVVMYL